MDEIDEWLTTLSDDWDDELERVACSILRTMAVSEESYTLTDVYRIFTDAASHDDILTPEVAEIFANAGDDTIESLSRWVQAHVERDVSHESSW